MLTTGLTFKGTYTRNNQSQPVPADLDESFLNTLQSELAVVAANRPQSRIVDLKINCTGNSPEEFDSCTFKRVVEIVPGVPVSTDVVIINSDQGLNVASKIPHQTGKLGDGYKFNTLISNIDPQKMLETLRTLAEKFLNPA